MGKLLTSAILFIFLIVFASLSVVDAQNDQEFTGVTPTPIVFPPPQFGEPELICPYFRDVSRGMEWHDLTIGVSDPEELEQFLEQLGTYEKVLPAEGTLSNSIGYRWRESYDNGVASQAPSQIDICIQDGKIMVLDMTWYYQPPLYINDLLAQFDQPDIVTWSITEEQRTVFWFELGMVAVVFVHSGDDASFGRITRMIYFPPQSSVGYENRWPFNITRTEPFYPVDPSISNEQNPFNFDSMIATITAEPSRTSTPTFTPPNTSTP